MSDRIRQLRLEKGVTQEELGKVIGVQRSAIRKYESGMVENLKRSSIQKLADYFGVAPSYLLCLEDEQATTSNTTSTTKKIPMLDEIACGQPIFTNQKHDEYIEVGHGIKVDFALKAKGDSMIDACIKDGDIVFCKSQNIVNNGEIGVVIIDDEATLKRVYYYPDKQRLVLQPENKKYEPLVYVGEELETIRIIGKAVTLKLN